MDDCVLYTPKEVAKRLGVTRETIYQWIKSGEIPACKIGGAQRVPADELQAVIASRLRHSRVRAAADGTEVSGAHER